MSNSYLNTYNDQSDYAGLNCFKQFCGNETWDTEGFAEILFRNDSDSFEHDYQNWIVRFASTETDFAAIKKKLVDLLESSDFLNCFASNMALRHSYQEKLTQAAEMMDYYSKAQQLVLNDEADEQNGSKEFINDLFGKLDKSGFVYHPRKNINIMMCLFVLKPELMEFYIEELFSIIFRHKIGIWKQYPFRTVMIQVLGYYILYTDDNVYAMANNSSAIDNTMRALMVQHTLGEAKDEHIFDRNLSYARLFRYASYKAMGMSEQMLNRAYAFLIGDAEFSVPMYSLYSSKGTDLLISYLNSDMITGRRKGSDLRWQYTNSNVRLLMANSKITIMPSETDNSTRSVLPNDLMKWNDIEVKVNGRVNVDRLNKTDILPYKEMWRDLENMLFSKHDVKSEPQKPIRRYLSVGDEVMITIDEPANDANTLYHCTILDPNILGEAYIDIHDIAKYMNYVEERYMRNSNGNKLTVMAKVVELDDTDDSYYMSLIDGIDQYAQYCLEHRDSEMFSCSVSGSYNSELGLQRGITYEGFPMALDIDEDEKLEHNTKFTGEFTAYDTDYHCLRMEFIDFEPTHKTFYPIEAFHRLMVGYSQYCLDKEAEKQKAIEARKPANIPTISRSHVVELMYIIDRVATLQNDYITSYNYLAVAKMLARMLGMDDKQQYYNGRMDLIEQLNYFAINNEVDSKKFQELEDVNGELFAQNVNLRKRYKQVRLISWLGKQERNVELRKTWEDTAEDEVISEIAGLALSYNILKQAALDNQASDVHSQIKSLLNLKGHESELKNYGDMEGVTCEFKTSIIYVPGASNRYDPDTQMDNILKVVDEMLNTRGGIIYIGVNRYGMGVGVKNDLYNIRFKGDKEEYIRFIYKYISDKISPEAANLYVHIDFDKENTKRDVCVIEVKPSIEGYPFKGEYCVRRGDSVYRYDKKGYEKYRKIRDYIYATEAEHKQTIIADSIPTKQHEEGNDAAIMAATAASHTTPVVDPIATTESRLNRNADAVPMRYLNFMGKGVYQLTDTQMGNIPLTLPIFENDEYVVVVYDDGTATCTATSSLSDREAYREYHGSAAHKAIYACTASKDDSLLLVVSTKAGDVMRMQDVNKLPMGTLLSEGKPVAASEATAVRHVGIVGGMIRDNFKKCRNMDCDTESKHGRKNMDKLIELKDGNLL